MATGVMVAWRQKGTVRRRETQLRIHWTPRGSSDLCRLITRERLWGPPNSVPQLLRAVMRPAAPVRPVRVQSNQVARLAARDRVDLITHATLTPHFDLHRTQLLPCPP